MPLDIKIRLMKLGKKQVDLLDELHKRGFATLDTARLSRIVNGRYRRGNARDILEASDGVLKEWEVQYKERSANN